VLTTHLPGGRLQSTIVWSDHDGGHLLINTMREFQKARNLFLVPVLHEQVQRGGFQALTRVRCPSAHQHSLSEATGSHHLAR